MFQKFKGGMKYFSRVLTTNKYNSHNSHNHSSNKQNYSSNNNYSNAPLPPPHNDNELILLACMVGFLFSWSKRQPPQQPPPFSSTIRSNPNSFVDEMERFIN